MSIGSLICAFLPGGIFLNPEEPLDYYNVSIGYHFLPGEVFLGASRAMGSGVYVLAGVGQVKFADIDSAAFNFGLGVRLLPWDWVSLRVEMRDHVFDTDIEDFEIVNTRIDNGKFNLTIQNTGELPINFTRLWISNVTDNSWPLHNFTINKIATPNQIISDIGQDADLYAVTSQAYSMKLVTQRGNNKEVSINSPSQEKMDLKLIALPTVPDKFRTTLLFSVTNNMTNQNNLLNIKPIMNTPVSTGTASYSLISTLTPNEQPTLRKGDTVNFLWVY